MSFTVVRPQHETSKTNNGIDGPTHMRREKCNLSSPSSLAASPKRTRPIFTAQPNTRDPTQTMSEHLHQHRPRWVFGGFDQRE